MARDEDRQYKPKSLQTLDNQDMSPQQLEDLYNAPAADDLERNFAMPSATQSGSDIADENAIDDLEDSFNGPDAKESGSAKLDSAKNLSEKESQGADKLNYTGTEADEKEALDKKDKKSKLKKSFLSRRKKAMMFGGFGALLGGGGILGFSMFLTLQFIHIPLNVHDAYNAISRRAVEKMGDNIFHYYVVKYLVPGMVKNGCTTTRRTKSCADVSGKTNIVTANFRAWRDANIEGKLAEKGIEIRLEATSKGNKVFLTTPEIREGVELGTYTGKSRDFEDKAFAQLRGKKEIHRELSRTMSALTLRDRMYIRFIGMPLIDRKYSPRYCIVACETRKKIKATKTELLSIAKGRFIERVITPLNTSIGLSLECALDGFTCGDLDSSESTGERRTKYQKDLQLRLVDLQSKYGKASIEELNKQADEIRSKGAVEYLIKQIAGETTAKIAVKVIPVVGWIDLGASLISGAQKAAPTILHMNYVMNETAMVGTATMALTYASELMSGSADPATLNSFSLLYGADASRDQGGGSAQSSPLYGAIMGGGTQKPVASLFPRAYAESTATNAMCDDGEGYPAGALICPNVAIGSPTGTLAFVTKVAVDGITNNPFLAFPGFVANVWVNIRDGILSIFSFIEEPLSKLVAAITPQQLTEVLEWLKNEVFAKIFVLASTPNQSGARYFETMVGGINILTNYTRHFGLGGKVLNSTQVKALYKADAEQKHYEYSKLPLYARMFSKENSNSLVSKIAMSIPSGSGAAQSGLIASTLNPLRSLASSIDAVTSRDASAAAKLPEKDPFGITQYGYAEDDSIFIADPEAYWESAKCDDPNTTVTWGNSTTRINDISQLPEHDQTNPCLLIRASVATNGGLYDKSLLPSPPATNTAVTLGGELGTVGNFTFPLKTTQTRIKTAQYQDATYKLTKWAWCYTSQTNCHHDYPAADIFDNPGTEVVAAVGGTVVRYRPKPSCSPERGGSPSIQIKGDDGNYYFYTHFRGGSLLQSQEGARIDQGQTLGVIGEPACAQGTQPHVHFQAYSSPITGNPTSSNVQPILIKAFGALPQ
ncbi:peptidoglycan DD-metalloendopeptidase family protein [Candidatus Saccharibacteria bacterium]|nr:MAG: peptidoglycan DD-metalloendopeptidase family protein [Candidatus Saccharibacteria bacterium]